MTKHINKSISNFSFLLIFLLYVVSIATAQTPQQIAQKAFRSTVLLVMEDKNGQPLSLGSGFFVGQGQIATNLHIVEGATRGYAKLVGKETKFNIEGYTAIDEKRDLIILKVTALGTEVISLGNSDLTQVGETVYAVGNPRGLEGTFSDGIISSIRPVGNDKLIQMTAPLSPGSSGGPVLNRKGEVIGVSVLTIRNGQNLNFAIPANYLKTLIAKVGYAKSMSQLTSIKGQRSILTDFGNQGFEGVTGGKFKWDINWVGPVGGGYTFSLRNRFRENVRNVNCLIIFYDAEDDPIDTDTIQIPETIYAGTAKRIKRGVRDLSVKEMSTRIGQSDRYGHKEVLETYVKFRILDYEIVR
ncbi:MAG: S1C family serine protease [Candidatus Poribacteria bacterium]|nr:S1C family serine protease [Candidatus Poribacteria bacterium]